MPRPGPSVTSGADLQPGSDSLFPSGFTGGGARPSAGSVGTSEIADGSVGAADLNLSSVAAAIAARSEFTGTYVQNTAAPGPLGGLAAALDANEPCALTILGDSTGNETTEWVYLFAQYLATKYPSQRVVYALWDDTAQEYPDWTVIQAGAGERHALFGGTSRTMHLPKSSVTSVTGDIDIRVKVALDDWTPAATQCIAARYGAAGARCWKLSINTSGNIDFTWTTDGTTNIQKVGSTPTGFADGTAGWIRATLDVDNGAGGYTWTAYTSPDGVTWTQVGISNVTTGGATSIYDHASQEYEIGGRGNNGEPVAGKIYAVQIRSGLNGYIVNPQPIDTWMPYSLSGANAAPTFGGTPTLYVLNGSFTGQNIAYFGNATRLPLLARPLYPCLTIINTGHNETTTGPDWLTALDTFLAQLKTRQPGAAFAICTQNPQVSPRTIDQILPQAARRRGTLMWGPRNGVAVVDTYKAFADTGNVAAYLNGDGLHPTNSVGSNTGSQLWASIVQSAFVARR